MAELNVPGQLEQEWRELLGGLPAEPRALRLVPPRAASLFAELEDVRATWAELRHAIPLEKYADRFITTGWTVKELLAHMASWATEFRHEVETVARGEGFD